jgi:hypothetical protein
VIRSGDVSCLAAYVFRFPLLKRKKYIYCFNVVITIVVVVVAVAVIVKIFIPYPILNLFSLMPYFFMNNESVK